MLVEALARTLQRVTVHARSFDADDIFNYESQISSAFVSQVAAMDPALFEFDAEIGSTQLVANFPLHKYEGRGRTKVRFADFALLDATTSRRGASRTEPATHNAHAFVELKYDFIPGPFRGSSPLKDLERLERFRKFNTNGSRPEGVLGVGFRWSEKSGTREKDGGAVTQRRFRKQERTFMALKKRLESGDESEWATLVYLDYAESRTGVPVVRALGQHCKAVQRALRDKPRSILVSSPPAARLAAE